MHDHVTLLIMLGIIIRVLSLSVRDCISEPCVRTVLVECSPRRTVYSPPVELVYKLITTLPGKFLRRLQKYLSLSGMSHLVLYIVN